MATHIQAQIDAALNDHLEALSLPSGVRIAWPNVDFKPNASKAYLGVQQFPNAPENVVIRFGAAPVRRGIYQVSVFGVVGKGAIGAGDLAGQISDHFTRGTSLTAGNLTVVILNEPTIAPGLQEKARYQIPVTIPWTVYPAV